MAAPPLPFGEDALCIRPHLVSRDVTHIGGESSQEPLDDVGMQLRFEVRPMNLRAAQNSFLKEIWSDVSSLYRMIRDPFFKMSWVAKTVPLCALAYLAFNSWLPGLPAPSEVKQGPEEPPEPPATVEPTESPVPAPKPHWWQIWRS